LARLGGGGAQLRPVVHDGKAGDRRPLVRCHVGIDARGRDLAHGEIELFGSDLQHAGGGALTELDLAHEHRRGVVGAHRNPRIEELRVRHRGGGRRRQWAEQRTRQRARDVEGDDKGAAFEKIAARQCSLGAGGHGRSSAIMRDASFMALVMRG
jgi:hypothetical protein